MAHPVEWIKMAQNTDLWSCCALFTPHLDLSVLHSQPKFPTQPHTKVAVLGSGLEPFGSVISVFMKRDWDIFSSFSSFQCYNGTTKNQVCHCTEQSRVQYKFAIWRTLADTVRLNFGGLYVYHVHLLPVSLNFYWSMFAYNDGTARVQQPVQLQFWATLWT